MSNVILVSEMAELSTQTWVLPQKPKGRMECKQASNPSAPFRGSVYLARLMMVMHERRIESVEG